MRLPAPLVRLRSHTAQALGLALRAFHPVSLRAGRFLFEVQARSQLRGRVAPGVQFVGPIHVEGTGAVDIGEGTRVGRRVFFETYGRAKITIGRNVTINDGVVIVAYEGVRIGDWTLIGEYSSIRDANHGIAPDAPVRGQAHEAAAVEIGRDVWIGRGVFAGRGTVIGDGAVVGANSVVTRAVAPNAIVAGAPAREIGERGGTRETR